MENPKIDLRWWDIKDLEREVLSQKWIKTLTKDNNSFKLLEILKEHYLFTTEQQHYLDRKSVV